jgi:hypothetical protein
MGENMRKKGSQKAEQRVCRLGNGKLNVLTVETDISPLSENQSTPARIPRQAE